MADCPSIQVIGPSAPFFSLQVPSVPGLTFFALSCPNGGGGGGGAAGVSSLNSLTGVLNVVGAGNISVTTDGVNQIFVSGNNVGGAVTQSQLDALSGWAASATGLRSTGSILYSLIVGLSGADANTYATLLNVTQSGVQLGAKIDSLSGWAQGMSGANFSLIAQTGQQAWNAANNNGINLSGNLTSTGVQLGAKIDLVSGWTQTVVSGGLETRITATGNSAVTHANGIGINLSGNLTQSGVQLGSKIDTVSGWTQNIVSGGLEARIIATGNSAITHANGIGINLSGNLTQTGVQTLAYANGIGTIISGNLTSTGQQLSAVKVTGSNIINIANFTGLGGTLVFWSGNQIFISGAGGGGGGGGVTSLNGLAGAINVLGTGGLTALTIGQNVLISGDSSISGALLSVSGALASQISANAAGVGTLNGLSGALNIIGTGGTISVITSGANTIYIAVTGIATLPSVLSLSGNLTQTGVQALAYAAGIGTIISGNLTSTGVQLGAKIDLVSGWTQTVVSGGLETRITATGNSAITHANGIGINLSGNLTQTGIQALSYAAGIGTIISGNLTSSGVQLGAKIDLVSGWTQTTVSGGLEIRIIATGNSAVTHANGIGTNLSGNLTQTGVQALNFANGIGTIISGNLTSTGVQLGAKINALSGFVTNMSGVLSQVRVTGSNPIAVADFSGLGGTLVFSSGGKIFVSGGAGGGSTSPGGTNTTIQFNDGGTFNGLADFTYNKSTRNLALDGQYFWFQSNNEGGGRVPYLLVGGDGGYGLIGAGSTSSGSNAPMGMSNNVGFYIQRGQIGRSQGIGWGDGWLDYNTNPDAAVWSPAINEIRLGLADSATPSAQILSVQGTAAGTTDSGSRDFIIRGAKSVGSGMGGGIVFQVTNSGAAGTSQNTLRHALRISPTGNINYVPIRIAGDTGDVTIKAKPIAGSWTLTLPDNAGSNGYSLTTDGNGVTNWTNITGGGGGSFTPATTGDVNSGISNILGVTPLSLAGLGTYITVLHRDGTNSHYTPPQNTREARGSGLIDVVRNAVSGDTIILGAQQFDLGFSGIQLPGYVNLRGAGQYSTTILSQVSNGVTFNPTCVAPGTASELSDFTLLANATGVSGGLLTYQGPLGFDYFGGNSLPSSFTVRRVFVSGDSDAFYVKGNGTGSCSAKIYDSVFRSNYDSAQIINLTGANSSFEFYNCDFIAVGPSLSANPGLVAAFAVRNAGANHLTNTQIKVFGGKWFASGGSQNYGLDARETAGPGFGVELHDVSITITGGPIARDINLTNFVSVDAYACKIDENKLLISATGTSAIRIHGDLGLFVLTGTVPVSTSGQFDARLTNTGQLLSAVTVTGSSIINNANFTGIGGTQVIWSGNQILISGGGGGGGSGNVSGPASSTSGNVALWDGTNGRLLKDSTAVVLDGVSFSSGPTDSGKIPLLDASGRLDISFMPTGITGASVGGGSGVPSVNGIINAVTIKGTGGLTVSTAGQNVLISGDYSISGALLSVSGALASRIVAVGGSGNVTGPASSTNNCVALWDGTSGRLLKDSSAFAISGILSGNGSADSGKIPLLNTGGKLDISFIPSAVGNINGLTGVLNIVGTGDTISVITSGGNTIYVAVTGIANLPSIISLSGNMVQTGIQLGAKIDSLSGFTLGASGALQALIAGGGTQVRITGSSTLSIADFTGIGGAIVFSSGGKVFVSGGAGGGGGTSQTNYSGELHFVTGLQTGFNSYFIPFTPSFDAIPHVQITQESIFADNNYPITIKRRTISGVNILLSDVLTDTGFYINILAQSTTGASVPTNLPNAVNAFNAFQVTGTFNVVSGNFRYIWTGAVNGTGILPSPIGTYSGIEVYIKNKSSTANILISGNVDNQQNATMFPYNNFVLWSDGQTWNRE